MNKLVSVPFRGFVLSNFVRSMDPYFYVQFPSPFGVLFCLIKESYANVISLGVSVPFRGFVLSNDNDPRIIGAAEWI